MKQSKKLLIGLTLLGTLCSNNAFAMLNTINGKWECIEKKEKMFLYVDDNKFEMEQKGQKIVETTMKQFSSDPQYTFLKTMYPDFKTVLTTKITSPKQNSFLMNFAFETNMKFDKNAQPIKDEKGNPVFSKKTKPLVNGIFNIQKIKSDTLEFKGMSFFMFDKKIQENKPKDKVICKKVNWF